MARRPLLPSNPTSPPARQAVHSHRPIVRDEAATPALCASCVQSNLTYLAGPELHGRGSGTEDEHHAAQFIADKLKLYGLTPAAGDGQFIQSKENHTWSVLGKIEGTDEKEQIILLSAHLDHLGVKDGKTYYGADDDASGTAGSDGTGSCTRHRAEAQADDRVCALGQ